MNSLEFVESRIKFFEEKIKEEEQEFKTMKTEDKHIISYYNKHIDILKEKKEIYEQIKTVLEAWEIAKENKVDLFHIEVLDTAEEFNYDLVSQYQLTEEEFNKLKKALEVE